MQLAGILNDDDAICCLRHLGEQRVGQRCLAGRSAPSDEYVGAGLDRCAQLIRLTRDPAIIQWLCQQAGGFFVRNPRIKNSHEHGSVLPAMNEIVQQFADLLEAITKAALHNSISGPEAVRIRKEWEELKTFSETFVHACEKGDFGPVKSSSLLTPR